MNSVSIQSLRVYLSMLEHGSLSAAGREMRMTQPAVSNHLHSLETRYGTKLLVRGRPLVPTSAGKVLALHAGRIVSAINTLEGEMLSQSAPRGELSVGASTTPAEVFVPQIAARYREDYPDVSLRVQVFGTEAAISALLGREIEIAVVGMLPDDPKLTAEVVDEDELLPIRCTVPGGSAEVTVREMENTPLVVRERGSATRLVVERTLSGAGIEPRIAVEMGSNAAVTGAVAEGMGSGIVPARTIRGNDLVETFRVSGLRFRRPFSVVTETGRSISPAAQAFIEACRKGRTHTHGGYTG